MAVAHTIQRQTVEATVLGNEHIAHEVMQRLSAVCTGIVASRLEKMLEPFDDLTRRVLIEEITIEAGHVSLDDMEAQLTRAIDEALGKLVTELRRPEAGVGARDPEIGVALHGLRALDKRTADVTAFVHFLRHGRLPWWYKPEAGETMRSLVSDIVGSNSLEPRLMSEVVATLESRSVARQRLARQFEPPVAVAIISLSDRKLADALQAVLFLTESLRASLDRGEALQNELVLTALDVLVRNTAVDRGPIDDLISSMILTAVERISDRLGPDDRNRLTLFRAAKLSTTEPKTDAVGGALSREIEPLSDSVPDDADVMTADGLLVDNAGVVILHPFLPGLFSNLRLYSEAQLLNVSRCALLIHHLATGSRTAEEHELTFAKVLCGLPIEFPLDFQPPVTQDEAEECEVLLESAIHHWEALRSTSPDGLRGNFLTRQGRLSLNSNAWALVLERQSYDVLLDHLPWGIGLVHLPWMRDMISVEWPT